MTTDNRMNEPTEAQVEAAALAICEAFPHSGGGSKVGYEEAEHAARAALVAAQGARQPSEDDREALARVMDTLAYYHCRSVNPKADHPHMGYHAMTEDQREHLREKQREAAEEIMRMIPSLSRAAVPDAATELTSDHVNALLRMNAALDRADAARAERDAALAAIERVRAINTGNNRALYGNDFEAGMAKALWLVKTALDGAPEPEEKP